MIKQTRGWRLLGLMVRMAGVGAVSLSVLAIGVSPASAGDTSEASRQKAKTLVDEGVQLYEQGKYQDALDRFRAAHDTYDSDKIYFNIGEALTSMEQKVEAAEAFDKFLVGTATDTSDAGTKKRAIALKAMQEFNRDLARLKIDVVPNSPNADIDIDSGSRIVRPGVVYVYRGRHVVKASAPGQGEATQTLLVEAGQQMPITLTLHPATNAAAPIVGPPSGATPNQNPVVTPPIVIGPEPSNTPPIVLAPQQEAPKPDTAWAGAHPSEPTRPDHAPSTGTSHTVSYVLWAVAGACVVGGTIWGVKVLSDNNNLSVSTPTVQTEEHIADAIWGGAVVAGATGTVLFFLAKPSPTGSGGEIGLTGRF